MSDFVRIQSVTIELSCPKRGQSEANKYVVSYFQSKKRSYNTLMKLVPMSIFSVTKSSFLNMYHVFPLLKDAKNLKTNICKLFTPFKEP